MLREVAYGFRSHPLLTLALIVVASIAAAAAVTAFLVAAVLAAAVLAALFIAYAAVREILRPASTGTPVRPIAATGQETAETLHRFLAAVDEFARLMDLAVSVGVDERAHGRAFRGVASESRSLHQYATRLASDWGGAAAVGVCIAELEAATAALHRYLMELQLRAPNRASTEILRWHRQELCRRRDALFSLLRDTDFRLT